MGMMVSVLERLSVIEAQLQELRSSQEHAHRLSHEQTKVLEDVNREMALHTASLKDMSGLWHADMSDQKGMIVAFRQEIEKVEAERKRIEVLSNQARHQLDGLRLRWSVVPALVVLLGAMIWIKVHEPEPRSEASQQTERIGAYYLKQLNALSEEERTRISDRLADPTTTRVLVFEPKAEPPPRPSKAKRPGRKR